jgi:dihydrofolate reductase
MKEIIIIAAAGENNELGLAGDLPWHLPDDFKHFKTLTSGHPILMGRKTFETFPAPLPNRLHLVISRDSSYRIAHPECAVFNTINDALNAVSSKNKVFIIGGGEIYKQAINYATKIELTRVLGTFEADTFFPVLEPATWKLIGSTKHPSDDRHSHAFTFETYAKVD